MKRIISYILLSAVIWGLQSYASRVFSEYCPGPYLGFGTEYQRFMGDREDVIIVAPKGWVNSYVPSRGFENNKAGLEGFCGWLYPICDDRFLIGWEAYASIDFNKATTRGDTKKVWKQSTLNRLFNAGILFKGGVVVCDDYFVYGLVGPDVGYFKWTESERKKDIFSRKKSLMGVRFGGGIERNFGDFRVGLQVDYVHYEPQTFSATDITDDVRRSHFKPNVLNVGLRLSIPLCP